MFLDFLFHLRRRGLPVSTTEWLTFLKALERGHAHNSLDGFYVLCRSICCRTESDYDCFDQCYLEFFKDVEYSSQIQEEIWNWLNHNPEKLRPLTKQEEAMLKSLNLNELKEQFEQRLKEQQERHDGGSHWIGTGGTSPFGHSGYHDSGMRVGGSSLHRKAMQVAGQRSYRHLRKDQIIDTRQIGIALKKLKQWEPLGSLEELNLEQTIKATSQNAGEISLIFQRSKRNTAKLILLMDIGGSMTDHSQVCEQLFAAATKAHHLKECHSYFFHNCPYEFLYQDIELEKRIPTEEVVKRYDGSWYCIFVGDAAMSPYELLEVGGSIDYWHHNSIPGLEWLKTIRAKFPKTVWLNPEPQAYWNIPSNLLIRKVFPEMFPMSLEGLEQAMNHLKKQA